METIDKYEGLSKEEIKRLKKKEKKKAKKAEKRKRVEEPEPEETQALQGGGKNTKNCSEFNILHRNFRPNAFCQTGCEED